MVATGGLRPYPTPKHKCCRARARALRGSQQPLPHPCEPDVQHSQQRPRHRRYHPVWQAPVLQVVAQAAQGHHYRAGEEGAGSTMQSAAAQQAGRQQRRQAVLKGQPGVAQPRLWARLTSRPPAIGALLPALQRQQLLQGITGGLRRAGGSVLCTGAGDWPHVREHWRRTRPPCGREATAMQDLKTDLAIPAAAGPAAAARRAGDNSQADTGKETRRGSCWCCRGAHQTQPGPAWRAAGSSTARAASPAAVAGSAQTGWAPAAAAAL